ncbi:signal peptidase I [Halapricum salinum]|uniref:Signal peptidase I n=1 Tax=Halapricum salinum TaxID=1457250 RepID=A0A4D6HF13_9EURY|nr:signal peptidase I [Halapricum salinum]QCC52644.1 signal peptidase I [Halapricum salinum]
MTIERPSGRRVVQIIAICLVLIVVIPLLLYVIGQFVPFYGGYVVLSNSMMPEFHSGDVVFVHQNSPDHVQINDTITYHTPDSTGTTTHKVVDIVEEDNQTLFQTQGIANEEPDPYLVPPRAYVGEVLFSVPLIGVLITFLQTDLGIIFFVLTPLSLLIVSESWELAVAYFGSRPDEDAEDHGERSTPNDETAPEISSDDEATVVDFELSSVAVSSVFEENWSETADRPIEDDSNAAASGADFQEWIAFDEMEDRESEDDVERGEL